MSLGEKGQYRERIHLYGGLNGMGDLQVVSSLAFVADVAMKLNRTRLHAVSLYFSRYILV